MIRIEISGWLYPSWRGNFYPEGLPHRRELEFASRAFNTAEINDTLHVVKELYASGYAAETINQWAQRIRHWRSQDLAVRRARAARNGTSSAISIMTPIR